jgi:hypothetical protein
MELAKKTTILFPPDLHEHLARVAQQRGVSMGALVRTACEKLYGSTDTASRQRAVEELKRLSLPVGSPTEMKRESVPGPDELLP